MNECGDSNQFFIYCSATGDGKMVKKDGDFKMDVDETKQPAVAAASAKK